MVDEERPTIERERGQFKRLLLANPNYFGNLADSPFSPNVDMVGNTAYEELTCVGFDHHHDLLEATIAVKRAFGYGGDLCSPGSQEYVRFFLDYGGGWQDQGVVALNIHDLPDDQDCERQPEKPLTYAASLRIEPERRRCDQPALPRIRAILSWQWIPPAGDPEWRPVWGNVIECAVQIRPRRRSILDYLEIYGQIQPEKIDLPPLEQEVFAKPIPIPDPPPFELADLVDLYGGGKPLAAAAEAAEVPEPGPARKGAPEAGERREPTSVEPHRFGFADAQMMLAGPSFDQGALQPKMAQWKELGLDLGAVLQALEESKADVSYEELECLGLDTNVDRLVTTFRIKRPFGYSGDLCSAGSKEHIAFWADWDDTCEWTYLDTVEVNVHDIREIPDGGLCYAAVLPVDLTMVKRPCKEPKVARVRAVLSWAVPPSTTDPDDLTTWGNRIDSHVQIPAGPTISQPTALLGILGGIPISQISPISGLTTPSAVFALNGIAPDASGRPCPFGGRVVLQGPSFLGYKYQVQVRKVGDPAWSTVTTTLQLWDWTGTVLTTLAPDVSGLFTFVPFTLNVDNVLAWWDTAGDDLMEIKLQLFDMANNPVGLPASHRIRLDNTAPEAEIEITSGAGNCGKYGVGDVVSGTFVARDAYLGSFSLGTSPFAGPVVPVSGLSQTPVSPGTNWSLNTAGMQPCGYVISVTVVDRAIVNSASVGHWVSKSQGFCLE